MPRIRHKVNARVGTAWTFFIGHPRQQVCKGYGFMMLRLKMGVESDILWSEIGSGFGDPFQQFLKSAYPLSLPLRTRVHQCSYTM